jgi:acyl-coenzyme A thioesterase PaaI-like protein
MDPATTDGLSPAQRAELEERWNSHPGMQHLGARVDLSTPGLVRASIDPIQPYHRGGLGTEAVNGAVIAGMFDLVIGLAGYLHTLGRRAGVAQLTVHFLRPVEGDRFQVTGWPTRVGHNLIFARAELRDQRGVVCAEASGVVAVSGRAHAETPGAVSL